MHLVTKTQFAEMCNVKLSSISASCRSKLKDAVVNDMIDTDHEEAKAYFARQWSLPGAKPHYTGMKAVHENKKASSGRKLPTPEQLIEREAAGITSTTSSTPPFPVAASSPVMPGTTNGSVVTMASGKRVFTPPVFANGQVDHLPEDVRAYVDWSLRALIAQFGNEYAFSDWLKAYKEIETIYAKQLDSAQKEGVLINRALVEKVVFNNLETLFVRLLSDGVKTISRRLYEMVKADRTVEECEKFVADQLSSFIAPTKDKMIKGMRDV